jgi:hypothetical protein
MEHVIAGYLRQIWEKSEWLYEGQDGFRPGYSCESQSQFVRILLMPWAGGSGHTIIIDFSKSFDLVPHGRLLKKK